MRHLFTLLLISFVSSSSFAYQCGSLFSTPQPPKNLELINSLKRIRNYGYFSNFMLIDSLHKKMSVVVFDVPADGVIENRPSLEDYILELRSFASEIRYVYNDSTKDQVLMSRIGKKMSVENLINSLEITPNNFNNEIFRSVLSWLSKPGQYLNIIVLPEAAKESFMEQAKQIPFFVVEPITSVIDKMDPL